MSYEEKYKQALERMKSWANGEHPECFSEAQKAAEFIFPELAESEDEKIRKEIMQLIQCMHDADPRKERWIAWLEKQKPNTRKREIDDAYLQGICDAKHEIEKQGEQKPKHRYTFNSIHRLLDMIEPTDRAKSYCQKLIDSLLKEGYAADAKIVSDCLKQMNGEKVAMATMDKHKRADKVEPKFKVGDWLLSNNVNIYQVVKIRDNRYELHGQRGEIMSVHVDYAYGLRLWTIRDAKEGDVLAFDDDTIVIFKDLYNSSTFHSYCHIEDGIFDISKDDMPDWWEGKGFQPATKEQRDLLFTKMEEAGYEWDADKKELKKIEPKFKIEKGKWYICIKDLFDDYMDKAFLKGDMYISTQDESLIPSNSNVPCKVVYCPDTYFREWTIRDAKDGDVLLEEETGEPFIYNGNRAIYFSGYFLGAYCGIYNGEFNPYGNMHYWGKNSCPATKEQRDLLFKKMKEAGYEWSDEKKELKKI